MVLALGWTLRRNIDGLHLPPVCLDTGKGHPCTFNARRPLNSVDTWHRINKPLHEAEIAAVETAGVKRQYQGHAFRHRAPNTGRRKVPAFPVARAGMDRPKLQVVLRAAKDAVFFNGDEIERNPGKLLHQWPKPGRTGTAKNVIPLSRQFGICPEKAECNHIPPYY